VSNISYVVEFSIKDDKVEDFKSKAEGCITAVKTNEPETLGCQWHLSEDGKHCLTQETFSSFGEDLLRGHSSPDEVTAYARSAENAAREGLDDVLGSFGDGLGSARVELRKG
jgi:hypothetical protein